MIEPYPLQWPAGRPRTAPEARQDALLEAAFAQAVHRALQEVRLAGGRDTVISMDVPLRADGTPKDGHDENPPNDTGVAVYFERGSERYCIACDYWSRVEDNILAVGQTLETLRRLQRIAGKDVLVGALGGFLATPPPGGDRQSWWHTLGVPYDAPLYAAEAAYRNLVKSAHPDRGGSAEAMVRLNSAIRDARMQLR